MSTPPLRLTSFSKGGGCGCKISPAVLQEILATRSSEQTWPGLLVGNQSNDDAAVFDLGQGQALVSTTDFFLPIVDDAFDFGQIAAANAISDVYAMGGKPLMAIAILGWPLERLDTATARRVMEGARAICDQAGIPLAGGHSVDTQDPLFGLSVSGLVETERLTRNQTARAGDLLYLTKPIGTGILSTAEKKELLDPRHREQLVRQMTTLNRIGRTLAEEVPVSAMTDVTGFGLLGHLIEMAEGSGVTAELMYGRLPVMEGARAYLSQKAVPDATFRNWNAYSPKTKFEAGVPVMEAFHLLPDPQTNGGILFSAPATAAERISECLLREGYPAHIEPIGRLVEPGEKVVVVQP